MTATEGSTQTPPKVVKPVANKPTNVASWPPVTATNACLINIEEDSTTSSPKSNKNFQPSKVKRFL